ncbi:MULTISPECIES: DUF397 domain-containing protein [Streptomyces]|nr:DUF397 domain-containing protein [Streptomyces xinghaiensis]KNE80626.1 hypothetical protein ADZ36_20970 [Streptomyces fradiae]OFA61739.1 DUF397 domain-containing protein [Streptomyces fradiae]
MTPNWRTSSYTKSDTCVEVADNDPDKVLVRDTKDRGRGTISVRPASWSEFVDFIGRISG